MKPSLNVVCPRCKAPRLEDCRTPRAARTAPHADRTRLALLNAARVAYMVAQATKVLAQAKELASPSIATRISEHQSSLATLTGQAIYESSIWKD
jgi:hypothetical protein